MNKDIRGKAGENEDKERKNCSLIYKNNNINFMVLINALLTWDIATGEIG